MNRRRAVLDVAEGSRLDRATGQDASIVLGIRCAACQHGARALGAVLNPAEGLLFVAYTETDGEFKALASFVDELESGILLRCRQHGRRELDASMVRTTLERRGSRTLLI